ncbi:MAG TPA: heparan-alpha-glucosaminide N-acetyltransferase domain-containing protein, partial [Chitinophagaceae bacterium]
MSLPLTRNRIQSIDILRGLIMVIMAIDHVRDFFHSQAMVQDPLNPETTTPVLYFTRWITHLCAPLFVFLSGTSAFLVGQRKSKGELSRFLITRGLWLILIEVTIVTFGMAFDPEFRFIILGVIWAIGISMVLLGILIWLPFTVILTLGIIIVFGHNILDLKGAASIQQNSPFIGFSHRPTFIPLGGDRLLMSLYPFLPWTGIMMLGYCIGKWFVPSVDAVVRRKRLLVLGSGLIIMFFILRAVNAYGDPLPWKSYGNAVGTFMSFMNVQKYPPSLLFASITIGIGMLLLVLFETKTNRLTSILNIYGRVPLFYFVVHFYVIHLLTIAAFYIAGYTDSQIRTPNFFILFRPPEFGYPLWAVYLIWFALVVMLYPLCKWYNNYKSTHRQWW